MGQPADMAGVVAMLAFDDASFTNDEFVRLTAASTPRTLLFS